MIWGSAGARDPSLPDPSLLGELARALAPRECARGLAAGGTEDGEVWLGERALAPELRREIEALDTDAWRRAGLAVEPLGPAGGPSTGFRLRVHAGARAALAQSANPLAALAARTSAAAFAARVPPRLMGIVNVTPDSFSDGGRFLDPEQAIAQGVRLAAEGAHYLDVGGESTRPGAEPVPAAEELERVVPVVAGLAERGLGLAISVDTQKAAVARAALDAGATIVNDVSAGRADPEMLALAAERGAGFVAMHMRGTPRDMQVDPRYADVVGEVLEFLRERAAACLQAGIAPSKIALDPGIGFGKRLEHNLALLQRLPELRSLGLPILMGVSRKSFLSSLAARAQGSRAGGGAPEARAAELSGATAAAVAHCVLGGAAILRVHDVAMMGAAARVAEGLANGAGRAGA